MTESDACRRCSECRGQSHHWCSEIRTDDGIRLQCKHCDATAEECEACCGGSYTSPACVTCGNTGIVDVREGEAA